MRKNISMTIEVTTIELIDEEAHRCGMMRSHFIESILKRHVGRDDELTTLSRRVANTVFGLSVDSQAKGNP